MNHIDRRVQAIRQHAEKFRNAIPKCVPDSYPEFFSTFPRGRCGLTSDLLAEYLRENGLGDFKYVSAYRGSMEDGTYRSHGWLEKDKVIVDITADQFDDAPAAVIVTRMSEWHRRFTIDGRIPAGIRQYDGTTLAELQDAYAEILRRIAQQGP